MRRAMYADTEKRCMEHIEEALKVADGTPKAVEYIKKQCVIVRKWASFARQSMILHQMMTTQRIESIHSIWKAVSSRGGFTINRWDSPRSLAGKLVSFFRSQFVKREFLYADSQHALFACTPFDVLNDLDLKSRQLCFGEYKKARNALYLKEEGVNEGKEAAEEQEEDIDGREEAAKKPHTLRPSSSDRTCEEGCQFFKKRQLPCVQIFLAALLKDEPSFLDSEFFLTTFGKGFRAYDDEAEEKLYAGESQLSDKDRKALNGRLRRREFVQGYQSATYDLFGCDSLTLEERYRIIAAETAIKLVEESGAKRCRR